MLTNRTSRSTEMTLTASDSKDQSLKWSAKISPMGVHRFELTQENTVGLVNTELRLRVDGMATIWGRPIVLKEFENDKT